MFFFLFFLQVPSVLILQMPRFGTQKMFERIFINPQLNLTNLIQRQRFCGICNKPAKFLCKECWKNETFRDEGFTYLCKLCTKLMHSHPSRQKHEPVELNFQSNKQYKPNFKCELELFAVVCICTSHHVSFVKCGNEWVFFDSMADNEGINNFFLLHFHCDIFTTCFLLFKTCTITIVV